jgi:phospholipid-binding lipoprotein MlaA
MEREDDMKKHFFYCLAVLFFIFHPALVHGEEIVTEQEKPVVVAEPAVEQKPVAEEETPVASPESPEGRAAETGLSTQKEEPVVVAEPAVGQKSVAEEERPVASPESPEGSAAETGLSAQKEEYEEIAEEKGIADPLEPWNRMMFTFNDRFYFWVLKPVAQGYGAIVPEWGRVRINNMFHNVTMPIRFVNNLLQLKIDEAGIELIRFVLNTTAGVLGMFDVAKNIDLKPHDEDLGQTLGKYGFGDGFYLVWPILGSSSLRDTAGLVGDYFLDPVSYITPMASSIGVRSVDMTNKTSLHIGDYEDLKESALDPYISFRNAYFQYRTNKIKE